MTSKLNERLKAWNLGTESDQHAEQLEENLLLENGVNAALDVNILSLKQKIEAL